MPHVWIKSHSRLRMIPFIDHLYLVMFYRPGFVGHWRHRHILPSLVEGDELKTCWTALVGLQQGSVLEENPLKGLGQQQSTTAVWKRRENIEIVMFSFQVLWVSQYDISSSKFSDRWKYKYPAGKGHQNSSCLSKENGLICKAKDPFYSQTFLSCFKRQPFQIFIKYHGEYRDIAMMLFNPNLRRYLKGRNEPWKTKLRII